MKRLKSPWKRKLLSSVSGIVGVWIICGVEGGIHSLILVIVNIGIIRRVHRWQVYFLIMFTFLTIPARMKQCK